MPPKKEKEDEEMSRTGPKISFSDLEKSMMTFTGDDTYPISTWIQEFEDTASIMEWSKIERLIYGKRLLGGTAMLFLRSLGSVTDWETLKNSLKEEFGPKLNSAIVHKMLASRKMKNDETLKQYFLHMKELALHASVEDEALMEYLIDGIRDSETNKAILYGARDLKEFRVKLESYSQLKKRIDSKTNVRQNNPTISNYTSTERKPVKKRCYNCGDADHIAPACTKGIKCFRCNEYGHKGTECSTHSNKSLNIRIQKEESKIPYKKIKINGVDMTAMIDTGSDVNLVKISKLTEFEDGKSKYENNSKVCLTGIGEKEINTEGSFEAKVQIDDSFIDTVFHVVKDEVLPVNLILGNPILHDLSINFTSDGITVEKLKHLTLLTEEKKPHDDPDIGKRCSIVLAKKKNGQYRLRTEYRRLKKKIIKKRFLLPLIPKEKIANYTESKFELRAKAKESTQRIQNKIKKSYSKKRKKAAQFNVGDLVAIKKPQFIEDSKVFPKFLGPYKLVQKKRNDRYAVKKIGHGEGPINTTNSADPMKPWKSYNSDSSGSDEGAG